MKRSVAQHLVDRGATLHDRVRYLSDQLSPIEDQLMKELEREHQAHPDLSKIVLEGVASTCHVHYLGVGYHLEDDKVEELKALLGEKFSCYVRTTPTVAVAFGKRQRVNQGDPDPQHPDD